MVVVVVVVVAVVGGGYDFGGGREDKAPKNSEINCANSRIWAQISD